MVGDAPTGSPGLGDDTPEYRALVAELWASATTKVGAGRVIAGHDVEAALALIGVSPDFRYTAAQPDAKLLFVHRKVTDGDLYFVDNRLNRAEQVEAWFRVAGKAPQLWHADTGLSEPVSYRIESNETVMPLALDPQESVFVVFCQTATVASQTVTKSVPIVAGAITGPWQVTFQPGRGAPATITLPTLASLSENADPGVKYFSGVSTYTTTFSRPKRPAWARRFCSIWGRWA